MKNKRIAILALVAMHLAASALADSTLIFNKTGPSDRLATPSEADRLHTLEIGSQLPAFSKDRSCLGITSSDEWLKQGYIGGRSINLRVQSLSGDRIVFEEDLTLAEPGTSDIRLSLRLRDVRDGAIVQMDQAAVDWLVRLNITEVIVADFGLGVVARYKTDDIALLRKGLQLREGELICLSGESDPVTVVNEEGVRRRIDF